MGAFNLIGSLTGGLQTPSQQYYKGQAVQGPGLGWHGPNDIYRPVLGVEAPTVKLSNPTPTPAPAAADPNPVKSQQDAEAAAYAARVADANNLLSRYQDSWNQQESKLSGDRTNALTELQNAYNATESGVGQKKIESQNLTDTAIGQAADTARSTQRMNRNVLRALGILGSTYAADKLQDPMNQFDVQRADLNRQNVANVQQLDNFLVQQKGQHELAVKQLESQYADLVGKIQSDRRFTAKDIANSLEAAKAAFESNLGNIATSWINTQNQVSANKANLAMSLAGLQLQNNPKANLSDIMNTSMATANQVYQTPQTAGIYDYQKRLLSQV